MTHTKETRFRWIRHESCEGDKTRMIETWLAWMRHDSHKGDLIHKNETWLIWVRCDSHEWDMTHMNETWLIWMSHDPYKWALTHMNETWLTWMNFHLAATKKNTLMSRFFSFLWGIHESCLIFSSPVAPKNSKICKIFKNPFYSHFIEYNKENDDNLRPFCVSLSVFFSRARFLSDYWHCPPPCIAAQEVGQR